MRYAVLGTGGVGRSLAGKLAELGHRVTIGTRDVDDTMARTSPDHATDQPFFEWLAEHPDIQLAAFAELGRVHKADRFVNATSGGGSVDALTAVGPEHLAGKLIVDIANGLDFSQGFPPILEPVNTDSLAERIQRAFPQARVVKTLNTMMNTIMVNPGLLSGPHDVFLSADDADAKTEVRTMLIEFGWPESSIIDLGDLSTARGTEMLVPLWLRLFAHFGSGDFNVHVQRG